MKNITISIGNSDNKLTQAEWSAFVRRIDNIIHVERTKYQVHFRGFSCGDEPWQNATWVVATEDWDTSMLIRQLANAAHEFKQDSIFFLMGEGEFIPARKFECTDAERREMMYNNARWA